jgi:hypothetical protein
MGNPHRLDGPVEGSRQRFIYWYKVTMITDTNILLQKNFKRNKIFDNIRDHNEQISGIVKNYAQAGMDPPVTLFFLIN